MTTDTDIHSLVGAYALDAVDDVERAAFNRHLRQCATCAQEVVELSETVGRLTDAVAVAPPAGMREAVFATVARTRQDSRRAAISTVTALDKWRRWSAAAVAAGVIALGVGATTWGVSSERVRDERANSARVAAVVGAPDARLVASDVAGGRVSLVVAPSRDAAVAVLTGLAAPGDRRVYQLWMLEGAKPYVSVGVLPVNRGSATVYVAGLGGARQFGLSQEPAGGSDAPTDVVARLTL